MDSFVYYPSTVPGRDSKADCYRFGDGIGEISLTSDQS
jgi:hypothetical protein